MTEEHKRKISDAHKSLGERHWSKRPEVRKKNSESKRGTKNHNYGIPMTEDQKQKISRAHLGMLLPEEVKQKISKSKLSSSTTRRGENHPLWNPKSLSWLTQQAKIRDDYTCQICGLRDQEIIEVDHIKPKSIYPDFASDINNLMCLCPNCHRRKTKRDRVVIAEYKNNLY